MALTWCFIKLIDKGPAFYIQPRIGFKGRVFNLIKFRTMLMDESLPETERIKWWGKVLRSTSLDELPELWNVIIGEMSLVGPRPLLIEYKPYYSKEQFRRHEVRPGITGLAQVSGRNRISWEKKFEYDLEYVEKHNLFMDLNILVQTFLKVIKRSDIDSSDNLSMKRFDTPIYLIGAGGHSKVVRSCIESMGFKVSGYYDDGKAEGELIDGVPVIGSIKNDLPEIDYQNFYIIGIGNNLVRNKIAFGHRLKYKTFIHQSAIIHEGVSLGYGTVVMAGAHIGPDSIIGDHAIINTNSTVEHDCHIASFTHIAPGATLGGTVTIDQGSLIGLNATVMLNRSIGQNVQVGSGAVVTKDLLPYFNYIGNPARRMQEQESGMNHKIHMARPMIEQDDIDAVVEVLKSKHLSLGPKQKEFEQCFKDYLDISHALAVSSGTTGLHLALLAMGIGKGDEVLVPSYTFISSVNVILYVGAIPVFVDVEPETYSFCVKDAEKKLSNKTKALIAVDVFGHPAPWTEINAFAKKHNLYTIDDCCEALGSEVDGKKIGSCADISVFAFYPNKQITTGEGGMLVTQNEEFYKKCAALCNQGRESMGAWLSHKYLGYNYRMDEMSAALGVTQFRKLDRIMKDRSDIAKLYNKHLENFSEVKVQTIQPNCHMSWFVYVIELQIDADRSDIIDKLIERGIPARAYFSSVHEQPYLNNYETRGEDHLPITSQIHNKTLALPFNYEMNEDDVKQVVLTLKEIIDEVKSKGAKAA